jgi:hypothetical protein
MLENFIYVFTKGIRLLVGSPKYIKKIKNILKLR